MEQKVIIDDVEIDALTFSNEVSTVEGKNLHKITFTFKVTSEEYHDITSLLYKNDFSVSVPKENLVFNGTIQNYTTSVTNLYEENKVGDFQLTLIEKS
ncbi:DUF3219 family protein [Oceanobacillus bengalensis]|uniref:DUF3219 family protein n=1 Tax=Oceanobacillus bengalensis TaxID=1435466 RepID=A0A494Z2N1_9BACI|nr:DUF3219 family protein [Oceanobacillus bengalensis]RKQ16786.1 DUF3219 family protein [Oceanobacillus bengalensis]